MAQDVGNHGRANQQQEEDRQRDQSSLDRQAAAKAKTCADAPSAMLKKVAFVRKYEIHGGISVPRQEQSVVDTRLGVGRAEMTIDFSNFAIDSAASSAYGIQW